MMTAIASDADLNLIFREARTHSKWLDRPVPDELLRAAYDLARMGPTSGNCQPMRILFIRSPEAKQKFAPALSAGNLAKTMAAPATAIFAMDMEFYELLPRLFERGVRVRHRDGRTSHGLGLFIAHRALQVQGGELLLLHSGAQGTALRLVLPQGQAG